jgi:UDP-glucose 4-epimerase
MAAALGVNTILESPLESISTNIAGSEVVLKAAANYKKRILIASTSEIYGKNPKQPLNESDDRVVGSPQKIRWSYSDAKAIEEAMAFSLNQDKGLKVTTARLFNTVGPRQSAQYGMVVPRFVKAALNNEPINIYGDGTQSRVFCHVQDAIEALLALVGTDATINTTLVALVKSQSNNWLKQSLSKQIQNPLSNTSHMKRPTPLDLKICNAGFQI